jgi:hypothetical protein
MKWLKCMVFSLVSIALAASTAMAVKTSYWTDNQSTDFKAGTTENIAISNLGRITLSPESSDLLTSRNDVSIVFDVRTLADGTILAATGSEGRLMIYRDKTWDTFYKANQPYIFSVEIAKNGKIYLGTGGSQGEVIELSADGKESKILFSSDEAKYIWQLKFLPDGRLAAATGPNGKLYLIDTLAATAINTDTTTAPSTKPTTTSKQVLPTGVQEIFSCKQKNLQAMIVDKAGNIYVGTDGEAIVYKIEVQDGKFINRAIYDANEKEISALTIDDKGYLYVGTASGIQGKDMAASYLTKPQGLPVISMPTSRPVATSSAPATTSPALEVAEDNTTSADEADKKQTKGKKADKHKQKKTTQNNTDKNTLNQTPPAKLGLNNPNIPRPPMPMPAMGGNMPSPSRMGQSNAVYRIDTLGFVTEIFRDKVDINAMIIEDDILYLGTGPEGWLFKVNPTTEEVILLAKTGSKDINDIVHTSDGSFILSTASPAKVVKVGPSLAKTGTFTSKVFDARQIARWGMITVKTVDPKADACTATVQTRSSEIKNPDDPGWSNWSKPADIITPSHITSPIAKYLQYKITFTSANGKNSLLINEIQIAWMQDNLAPKIASVTVNTGNSAMNRPQPQGGDDEEDSEGPAGPMMPPIAQKAGTKQYQVSWKAMDPNGDPMKYTLYLKRLNTPYWIELQKDYDMTMFKWDSQTVPDGRYEFKVLASDALANPLGFGLTGARVSDPFVVDNTPPAIKNLECKLIAPNKLLIKADIVDEQTEIQSGYVIINGSKDWQYIAPADELYDSKTEKIDCVLDVPADNKPIMVTIKMEDRSANIAFGWQIVPADK